MKENRWFIVAMASLTQLLNRWQQAKVSLNGINQLMDLPVDNPQHSKKIHKNFIKGYYSFQNTALFYGEESQIPALYIQQLNIKPGEKIAVLGRNGAGKSTLLQALSGLLEPRSGLIKLDHINISHIDPADVRRDIGLISQNSTLFHGSIRDNLTLGAPYATDESLLQALKITGAMEFIQKLPTGLDYIIAEGGIGLSGGQKQSLLLARILVKDPNIILLDEPTASMDDITERQFINGIQDITRNKTLIIATHKMSIINIVDRIITIANGQIVMDEQKDIALAKLSKIAK